MIGSLYFILFLPECRSLKDKRRILKSLIEKTKNKFNVSIIELGHQDLWQKSLIGIAYISKDQTQIEKTFQKIEKFVESIPDIMIADRRIDFFSA